MRQASSMPQRPAGNLPKGSPRGLVSACMLLGIIPFFALQTISPLLRYGIEIWVGSLPFVLIAVGCISAVVFLNIRRRGSWYVRLIFALGSIVLAAYAGSLFLDLLLLLGVVPGADPELYIMDELSLGAWVFISPLCWLVLRMLRLHYWQPWTSPDQWEPPDDTTYVPSTPLTMWIAAQDEKKRASRET